MAGDDEARIWDLIEQIGICMAVTRSSPHLRARPLHAKPDRADGCIWFVTDALGGKDDEIASDPDVCLTFADPKRNSYVSISGRAEMLRDTHKLRELWDGEAAAWWPGGPDDPAVRALRVVPLQAEFWDRPASSIVIAFKLAAARIAGEPPALGENRKVSF